MHCSSNEFMMKRLDKIYVLKTKYIMILFFYLKTFRILRLLKIINDNVFSLLKLAMGVLYAHMYAIYPAGQDSCL